MSSTSRSTQSNYTSWSNADLIKRVTELEKELRLKTATFTTQTSTSDSTASTQTTTTTQPTPTKTPRNEAYRKAKSASARAFDPKKYTTRHIALKFAYLGAGYNGFEHSVGNFTPLPTVEEEVWKALVKCRLIFPPSLECRGDVEGHNEEVGRYEMDEWQVGQVPVDWEGCNYSKCGRTDRGVSAFGQVIGIRVRSARRAPKAGSEDDVLEHGEQDVSKQPDNLPAVKGGSESEEEVEFDPIKDELPYIPLLNKVLPPTIRMLAWCPNPPSNFDARFSCKERRYRYFFTNPAFLPILRSEGLTGKIDGYLDISSMQKAAEYLVGSHDFRNLCKIDPSKQLTTFLRRITYASVERVSGSEGPGFVGHPAFSAGLVNGSARFDPNMELYTFTVQGSAFLWHQVRCMVGILFLVGQGLEKPSIIKELLDVAKNPQKPKYEMASDKPLVLWDCMFSTSSEKGKFGRDEKPEGYVDRGTGKDELEWVCAGDEIAGPGGKWGRSGIMEDLWKGWRKAKMDEVLAGQLMELVASQGLSSSPYATSESAALEYRGKKNRSARAQAMSTRVFEGDDTAPSRGKYVLVMKKEVMAPVEIINERYLARKAGRNKTTKEDSPS